MSGKPKGLIGAYLQLRRERKAQAPPPPTVQDALEGLRTHLRESIEAYETAVIDRKVTAVWVVDCGLPTKEAAAIVGAHENTVRSWQRETQAIRAKRGA